MGVFMKVKIIRMRKDFCYDCGGQEFLYPVTSDWEEVSQNEYYALQQAIGRANSMIKRDDDQYVLVSYSGNESAEVSDLATKWLKKFEEDRKKEEERKAKEKERRAETALKRKQKQLEKLKKELGETG